MNYLLETITYASGIIAALMILYATIHVILYRQGKVDKNIGDTYLTINAMFLLITFILSFFV